MRKMWAAVLIFIAIAAAGGGLLATRTPHTEFPPAFAPGARGKWLRVKKEDFTPVRVEDGRLLPVRKTALSFTRRGKIAWLAPEGSFVKKGAVVMRLEADDLRETLERQEAETVAAEAETTDRRRDYDTEKEQSAEELRTEIDRKTLAEMKEKELLSRPDETAKQTAAAVVREAEAQWRAATKERAAFAELLEKGFCSADELEKKKTAEELAQCRLEEARLDQSVVLAGATATERRRAHLETRTAEIGLALFKIKREQRLLALEAAVRGAERRLSAARRRQERTEKRLRESTCRAPHDGVVAYQIIGWRSPHKPAVGDTVSPWRKPIALPDYSRMKVRTLVPEALVGRLKVGKSRVRVYVVTQPDRVYSAVVSWLDRWAWDRNESLAAEDQRRRGLSGVRVFNLEAELEESDPERLREGFQARVEFPLETLRGVLTVPARALYLKGGRRLLRVRASGKPRLVETGAESAGRVVVEKGLRTGEEVFVPDRGKEKAPASRLRVPRRQKNTKKESRRQAGPSNTGSKTTAGSLTAPTKKGNGQGEAVFPTKSGKRQNRYPHPPPKEKSGKRGGRGKRGGGSRGRGG